MKILFIEDDRKFSKIMQNFLIKNGIDCDLCHSVSECLSRITMVNYDVILADLDLGTKGDDGAKLIKSLQ